MPEACGACGYDTFVQSGRRADTRPAGFAGCLDANVEWSFSSNGSGRKERLARSANLRDYFERISVGP